MTNYYDKMMFYRMILMFVLGVFVFWFVGPGPLRGRAGGHSPRDQLHTAYVGLTVARTRYPVGPRWGTAPSVTRPRWGTATPLVGRVRTCHFFTV